MEEEEQGVSFGRICKVAFHRWKLLLIITLSVGLVGFLGIYFGYNYFFNNYNVTFSYKDTGLASEVKADNTTFNYRSLISKETLTNVKALKEEYAAINVDQLVSDNAFSITRKVDEKDQNNISYTISVKRRQMPSKEITKSFFTDLANYPIQQEKEYIAKSTFDSSLQNIDSVEKCEDIVTLLNAEATTLISGYNGMEGLKISSTLFDKIETNKLTIYTTVSSDKMNVLSNLITTYGLVPDYQNINVDLLNAEKLMLDNDDPEKPGEKQINNELITKINAQIEGLGDKAQIADLNGKVVELLTRNSNIDARIRQINEQIKNAGKTPAEVAGNELFNKQVKKTTDELYAEITEYKAVMNEVYVDNAQVVFNDTNNIVEVTKSMNVIYSILIPVLVGFVAGLIVNLIVDRKMLRDEEPAVEPAK